MGWEPRNQRLRKVMVNFFWLVAAGTAIVPAVSADELPPGVVEQLETQLYPAMARGNDLLFCDVFAEILRKGSAQRMQAVEADAASRRLPSPRDHFLRIRLMQIEQGLAGDVRELPRREVVVLADGINRRLQEFQAKVLQHPAMADPLQVPEHWKDSRDLFWDLHVFKNEFANVARLLRHGTAMLAPARRKLSRAADSEMQQIIDRFDACAQPLLDLKNEIHEREAELRLIRFERSCELLTRATDFESRLIAAMSVALDFEVLAPLLSRIPPDEFSRNALQQPGLLEKIQQRKQGLEQRYPEIMNQARLFREGMHWWLRGRYGRSSLANGLLKPEAAVVDPAVMNGLYMPRRRPSLQALSEGKPDNLLAPERRHYYTWAVEYRPLISAYSRETASETTDRLTMRQSNLIRENVREFNQEEFFY